MTSSSRNLTLNIYRPASIPLPQSPPRPSPFPRADQFPWKISIVQNAELVDGALDPALEAEALDAEVSQPEIFEFQDVIKKNK